MGTDLDVARDYQIEALATVSQGAVNAKLQDMLGGDAIENVYGAPLPLGLIPHAKYPALCVYRLTDQDRDLGDWLFEDTTVFQFDYYPGPTTRERLDKRWPLLRLVWSVMLGPLRMGQDPAVGDEAEILKAAGLFRYVLGSARNTYLFAQGRGGGNVYPLFRGRLSFEGCYPAPDSFDAFRLTPFETFAADWDLIPETNTEIEMQQLTELPQ